MIDFNYQRPRSLEDAFHCLEQSGEHRILAGGTDLLVQIKNGLAAPESLVSLADLPELRGVEITDDGALRIGAASAISDVIASSALQSFQPALSRALSLIGSMQIRNRATVGGNLCNASPAADSAPLLLALGAEVELLSSNGKRLLSLDKFFLGGGQTALAKGELMSGIFLPPKAAKMRALHLKQGIRQRMDIAIASVAAALLLDGGVCKEAGIAFGSLAPRPIRAVKAEQLLLASDPPDLAAVAAQASLEAAPSTREFVRASVSYRRDVAKALTLRILETLFSDDWEVK